MWIGVRTHRTLAPGPIVCNVPDYDTDFNPEPRAMGVRRRLVSIPRSVLFFVALTVLFPLLALVATVVDVVRAVAFRRPFMALRMLAFGWMFLFTELAGITRFFGHWLMAGFGARRAWMVERAWPVQAWWARTLLGSVLRLFRMKLEVEDMDVARPGPIIAMFRHASIIDNLLPAALLTDRLGIKLRWIIKKELLSLPSLDVGGNRLPNYFVDRNADDPRSELRRIKALTSNLDDTEGVLIYPEGTRFTPERKARALQRLEESRPELVERARALRTVMPPRPAGSLALLDSGHDVVVCAHEGLGGFARVADIWSGAILGRTIKVSFRRISAADIPKGRRERVDWLFDQWRQVDDWITSASGAAPA